MAKNAKTETKRGRGRPSKFEGKEKLAKAVAAKLKEIGKLGPTREYLAETGVEYQPAPGKKKITEKVEISLPTLAAIGRDHGVELKRGRPALTEPAKVVQVPVEKPEVIEQPEVVEQPETSVAEAA